jgi:DNA-binding SARP family transcriptional activator
MYDQKRYAFNRNLSYWYDIESFEWYLEQGRQYYRTGQSEQAIAVLQQARALYRGDFLEDFPAGDWAFERCEELRRFYQEALSLLGQLFVTQHQWTQAVETYHRLIAHDRYQESAHRELMRCYALLGERSQALRHYLLLARWMSEELGAQPSAETVALFQHLRGQEESRD